MKKISVITLITVIISLFYNIRVNAVTFTPGDTIHSEAAYLINLDTDSVIYEKNSEKQEYPASLTKIMTAILVIENVPDLKNTMIEAPAYVFDELYMTGASTADFRPYETASAQDLMYGMLLQSACEAASILGNHVGGNSISNFVDMMNAKAKEIGAVNTNFVNAHGLFDSNQYTTAKDMALITKYAMKLPKFKEIVSTYSYQIAPSNKHTEARTVTHTNLMMSKTSEYYYPNVRGIKTGTLDESGRCLITYASKDGYNYLLVVMNAPLKDEDGNNVYYNFTDTKALYEWAFTNFSYTSLLSKTEAIGEVSVNFSDGKDYVLVNPSEDFSALWPSTVDPSTIQRVIDLKEEADAPIEKGQKLGTMELKAGGETLTKVDLIAAGSVKRSDLKYNLYLAKKFTSSLWFKIAVGAIIAFIIFYIFVFIAINRKKKKRKIKHVNKKRQF